MTINTFLFSIYKDYNAFSGVCMNGDVVTIIILSHAYDTCIHIALHRQDGIAEKPQVEPRVNYSLEIVMFLHMDIWLLTICSLVKHNMHSTMHNTFIIVYPHPTQTQVSLK